MHRPNRLSQSGAAGRLTAAGVLALSAVAAPPGVVAYACYVGAFGVLLPGVKRTRNELMRDPATRVMLCAAAMSVWWIATWRLLAG